ncbi:beta-1,3-glucanase family protein [Frondihabitans sp. 4ASC-45]|uniref:beta-1,3-glucanase family protein n=1 Tax=Frondihabitans sp. 4ASC-45 TaxID=3111636 RepID=UPI003C29996C
MRAISMRSRVLAAVVAGLLLALVGLSYGPLRASAADLLPYTVTNNSGLTDATYVYIMAKDQATGAQGYVDAAGTWHKFTLPTSVPSGTAPPAAPDTSIAGPATGGTKTLQLRSGLIAGRIYMSFSTKLKFFLTPKGLVEPAGWVKTDPNYGTIYDWVEFARDGSRIFINTTMVDMFSVPISVSVTNADGSNETQGRLVGNGRNKIFNALKSYGWGNLIQYRADGKTPVRAMAPIHGVEAGTISASYMAQYVTDAWTYYTSKPLTVVTALGKFTGKVKSGKFVFTNAAGATVGTFTQPTTSDLLACQGATQPTGQPNQDAALAIGARLCAAFNRGTMSTAAIKGSDTQATYDATAFYPPGVKSNLYSKAMHLAESNGNAYGFAFDDVAEFSPSINADSPRSANMTVAPFSGSTDASGKPMTTSVDSLFGKATFAGYSDDPVNVATGNYTDDEDILDFADAWSPRVSLSYNSRNTTAGSFGTGWTSLLSESVTDQGSGKVLVRWPDGSTAQYVQNGTVYTAPKGITAALTQGSTGWSVSRQDGSTEKFDAAGRVTSFTDASNRTLSIARDSANKPTGLTASDGHSISLGYTGSQITTVQGSDGRVATLGYDATGHLTSITDPSGGKRTFAYDTTGYLTTATDADGKTIVTNRYDKDGRVLEQLRPGDPTEEFVYDTAHGATDVTAADGTPQMHYEYDVLGRLTTVTAADGTTATRTYDASGFPTHTTDRSGAATDTTYTAAGLVSSVTRNGATTKYAYDTAGRNTKITGPSGEVVSYTFTGTSRIPTGATLPDGSTTSFDVSGSKLNASTDADGKVSKYTYDPNGNVASITTPTGDVTAYTYDSSGRTKTVTDGAGKTTTYGYDDSGRQTSVTDPRGAITKTAYTPAGRVASTTDADGLITTFVYDTAGRLATTTAPGGAATTYGYDAKGDLTKATDPTGAVTTLTYDAFGRAATSTLDGKTTTYSYDSAGRQTASSVGGQVDTQQYDDAGRLISSTDADGDLTKYVYDALGRLTRTVAPDGTTVSTGYDVNGNATSTKDELGRASSATYTPSGLLATSTDPMGYVTKLGYDASGHLTTKTTPGNHVWSYAYDAAGRQKSITSPNGLVTQYGYDAAGNQTSVSQPGQGTVATTYSAAGKVTSVTDATKGTSTYTYDASGQMDSATDAAGGKTKYGYDAAGRMTSQVDPLGNKTTYAYDPSGQLTAKTDPLGRKTAFTYDASGNVLTSTDPDNKQTSYGYDRTGQLISRTDPSGKKVSWTYDNRGHRTGMTDSTGTTKYTYDAAGQLTKLDNPNGSTFAFTYDGDGRPATINYPDGTVVSYGRDADGNLAAVSDNHGHSLTYSVDPDGKVTREGSAAGAVRTFTYLDGQLSKYTQQLNPQADTATTDITRDAAGRISTLATSAGTTSYGYDAAGQLTSADGPGNNDSTYAYDAAGNRTASTVGGTDQGYTYDAANELTGISKSGQAAATLAYDGAGRLTNQTGTDGTALKLGYDGGTAPIRIERTDKAGNLVAALTRNGDGDPTTIATTQQAAGATTSTQKTSKLNWLSFEGLSQVATLAPDTSGATPTDFFYGDSSTRLQSQTGTAGTDLSRDALGSSLASSGTAQITDASSFDAYGAGADTGATSNLALAFGYRGQLTVAGLPLMGARAYDPQTGRFAATDPLDPVPGDPATATPYPYANNNPLNLIDPLGLRSVSDNAFSDFLWGAADGLTFGLTRSGRQAASSLFGYQDTVNYTSGWYKGGTIAGAVTGTVVLTAATGGLGGAVAVGAYSGAAYSYAAPAVLENRQASAGEIAFGAVAGAAGGGAVDVISSRVVSGAAGTLLRAGGAASAKMFGRFSGLELRQAAQAADRAGFTQAGRALQKHSDRVGSVFRGLSTGTTPQRNQQGLALFDEILNDAQRTDTLTNVIHVFDSRGRGLRFKIDGSFMGFLEP